MVLKVLIEKAAPAWKAEPFDFGPPAPAPGELPWNPYTVELGRWATLLAVAVVAVVVWRLRAR